MIPTTRLFSKVILLQILLLYATSVLGKLSCTPARLKACLNAIDQGKKCPVLPVPVSQVAPFVPEGSFLLTPIRSGVWSCFASGYRSVIIFKKGRLVLIDVPLISNLQRGVSAFSKATLKVLGDAKPRRIDIVYSHRHYDHIGGAGRFYRFLRSTFPRTGILIWGTKPTKDFVLRVSPPAVPVPNVIVGRKGRTVDISRNLKLELKVFGGHTDDDLLGYIRPVGKNPGFVYVADLLGPGAAPYVNFLRTNDVGKFIAAHRRLLKMKFGVFSAGHSRLGNRKDVQANLQYTLDVIESVKRARRNISPQQLYESIISKVIDPREPEFNNNIFFYTAIAKLASKICYRGIVQKYGCVLASVDLIAFGHCETAYFYNLIDNGETVPR